MPLHAKRKANRRTTPLGRRKLPRQRIGPRERQSASLTCRKEVDYIARYFASELRRAERAAFEHHLEICPDCSAFLQTYKTTVELTKSFLGARSLNSRRAVRL